MNRLLLTFLLMPMLAVAKVPDEEDILGRTMNTGSPYYYTSLRLRYDMGDSTLTDEDYHYLYYGYAYQEAYKPLEANPYVDRVLMLAAALNPDMPERETLENRIGRSGCAEKRSVQPETAQSDGIRLRRIGR